MTLSKFLIATCVLVLAARSSQAQAGASLSARDSSEAIAAGTTRAATEMLTPNVERYLIPRMLGETASWTDSMSQRLASLLGARTVSKSVVLPPTCETVRVGWIRQEGDSIFVSIEVQRTRAGSARLVSIGKEYVLERKGSVWTASGVRFLSGS